MTLIKPTKSCLVLVPAEKLLDLDDDEMDTFVAEKWAPALQQRHGPYDWYEICTRGELKNNDGDVVYKLSHEDFFGIRYIWPAS